MLAEASVSIHTNLVEELGANLWYEFTIFYYI